MIYDIMAGDDYEWVFTVNDEGFEAFRTFDGSSQTENWRPVLVERAPIEEDGRALPSDFPWMGSGELIMRTRAMCALRDMLEAGGEILPLATGDDVPLYALNVTRVIDAMDLDNSRVARGPYGEIIIRWTHAFHESMVRDVPFFKLPYYGSPIFVGDPFIERVQQAGLVGLKFQLAWSPETGAVYHKVFH